MKPPSSPGAEPAAASAALGSLPPADNPVQQPTPPRSFALWIQNATEKAFRLLTYFVWTCLALAITALVCTPDPVAGTLMDLGVVLFALFFWLYVVSVSIAPLLDLFIRHYISDGDAPWIKWGSYAVMVACAVFFGFFAPLATVIDAYVLQLFPEAAECAYYSFAAEARDALDPDKP